LLGGVSVLEGSAPTAELTPEKSAPVSGNRPRSQRIAGSLIAALFVAMAAIWWWRTHPPPAVESGNEVPAQAAASDNRDRAIAVLPFANLSGDEANQYFSDGVAEEILNVLGQLPRLSVTSRSSSFAYRDQGLALPELAEKLGVEMIMEGSVRKWDDQVRVSVQLIDAQRDELLWSETYERSIDNLFVIQEEIARSVADTLKIALDRNMMAGSLSSPRLRPVDPEAHEAYLQGLHLMAPRTRQGLEGARTAFEQAIEIEPDYAEAMSQLAIVWLLLNRRNYGNLSEAETLGQGRRWSSQALELAPDLAEAQAAAGMTAWRAGLSAEAEAHFERALEINPSYAIVWHWLGMLQYRNLGKHEASLTSVRMSRILDPVSIPSFTIYTQMLIARGQLDEASAEMENFRAISPASYHRMRGELESLDGRWANVALANLDALMIDPELASARRFLLRELFRLGLEGDLGEGFPGPVTRSAQLARLGRSDEAVVAAEQALADDPESVFSQQRLAMALIYNDEPGRARPLLDGLFKASNRRVAIASSHFFGYSNGMALYQARKAAGDLAGAEEILVAFEEELKRTVDAGITMTRRAASPHFIEGFIRYFRGDHPAGLELVRQAVEEGYYVRLDAPFLEPLVSDPRFEPIRQLQKANVERERNRFLNAVCDQNPYEDLWGPSPETCDQQR
jgi:TolB-like protein/Tfp pilus assembly protein PilF